MNSAKVQPTDMVMLIIDAYLRCMRHIPQDVFNAFVQALAVFTVSNILATCRSMECHCRVARGSALVTLQWKEPAPGKLILHHTILRLPTILAANTEMVRDKTAACSYG